MDDRVYVFKDRRNRPVRPRARTGARTPTRRVHNIITRDGPTGLFRIPQQRVLMKFSWGIPTGPPARENGQRTYTLAAGVMRARKG